MSIPDRSATTPLGFVQHALDSLRQCAVGADAYVARWFVRAFNNWYVPAVQRRYSGSMAPVFDVGLLLVEPGAAPVTNPGAYLDMLHEIDQSPLMELARKIVAAAPEPTRPEVEWTLVESVLRRLPGVWGHTGGGPPARPEFLPYLVAADPEPVASVRRVGDDMLLGQVRLSLPHGDAAAARPPLTTGKLTADQEIPDRVGLFLAHMAARSPAAVDRLDYGVVEACLHGPNLRPQPHRPPRTYRTELETRTRSDVPGPTAGVTRIEPKKPEDPFTDVLPSELAPLRLNKREGLARLLFGKPLTFQHENERDLVPKHRALVCFVVDAGAEAAPACQQRDAGDYRHHYIYSKRQVFDLVRDLREALQTVPRKAVVEIDVAVFALRERYQPAVVHRMFPLTAIDPRQSPDVRVDRLTQMMGFSTAVPDFFDALPADPRASLLNRGCLGAQGSVEPHVDQFLSSQARARRPYHAICVVVIGSTTDLGDLVTMAGHQRWSGAGSRQRLVLIGVDPGQRDLDPLLGAAGEPVWRFGEARTFHEATRLLNVATPPATPLHQLRRRFTEIVIGDIRGKNPDIRHLVRLS